MTITEFIKDLIEKNKKFFTAHKGYLPPEISEEMLNNVISTHKVMKNEEILWIVDTTLSGNATDSTILTNFGIYFREKILGQETRKKILWREIEQFYYDKKKGFVFLNKKGEEVVFERLRFDVFSKKDTEQIQTIEEVISQIIEFIKSDKKDEQQLPLSDDEKQFIEDINFMLEDDGEIIDTEMSILKKLSKKYGIDDDRAEELINQTVSNYINQEEKEYIQEVINAAKDGQISDSERRSLDFFREKLNISKEKAEKLEVIALKNLKKDKKKLMFCYRFY